MKSVICPKAIAHSYYTSGNRFHAIPFFPLSTFIAELTSITKRAKAKTTKCYKNYYTTNFVDSLVKLCFFSPSSLSLLLFFRLPANIRDDQYANMVQFYYQLFTFDLHSRTDSFSPLEFHSIVNLLHPSMNQRRPTFIAQNSSCKLCTLHHSIKVSI